MDHLEDENKTVETRVMHRKDKKKKQRKHDIQTCHKNNGKARIKTLAKTNDTTE